MMGGENESPQTFREDRTKNRYDPHECYERAIDSHSVHEEHDEELHGKHVVLSEADVRNETIGSPVAMHSLKNDHMVGRPCSKVRSTLLSAASYRAPTPQLTTARCALSREVCARLAARLVAPGSSRSTQRAVLCGRASAISVVGLRPACRAGGGA